MKHFCCESFQYRYNSINSMGLNIRIVKPSKEFIKRAESINLNFNFEKLFYYVTEGYEGKFDNINTKSFQIFFCPFCATKLDEYYKSETYIQEFINCYTK